MMKHRTLLLGLIALLATCFSLTRPAAGSRAGSQPLPAPVARQPAQSPSRRVPSAPAATPIAPPLAAAQATPSQGNAASPSERASARYLPITLGAGDGPRQVGISPRANGLEAQGPEAIRAGDDGLIYVLDTLNKRVMVFDPRTGAGRVIPLGGIGYAGDLSVAGRLIYVMDRAPDAISVVNQAGRTVERWTVPEASKYYAVGIEADGHGRISWQLSDGSELHFEGQGSPGQPGRPAVRQGRWTSAAFAQRVTMRDRHTAQVQVEAVDGTPTGTTIQVEVPHVLGGARLLRRDAQGNSYVLVEELLDNVPAFVVETTVRRYSPAGALTGVALLPTQGAHFVPNRFVDVAPAGEVYYLRVDETSAQIVEVGYQAAFTSRLDDVLKGSEPNWRRQDQGQPAPASPGSTAEAITPDQIMATASAYADLQWTASAANLDGTACSAADERGMPAYLDGYAPGSTVTGVPYKWGGYDTVPGFQSAMAEGLAAGDVNWSGGVILDCASGVDCSGFVSRAWNVAHCTTDDLDDAGYPLESWSYLQPGDAVNSPSTQEGHVLLFVSFAADGLNTIESTLACGGLVCRYHRTYTYLNGNYYPLRDDDVTSLDDPPPAPSDPSPPDGSTVGRTYDTTLSWSADASSCDIHIWGGGSYDQAFDGESCGSFELGSQPPGVYDWQVTAHNGYGQTDGPVWQVDVQPYAPADLGASAASQTEVDLAWTKSGDDPGGVDSYRVYSDSTSIASLAAGSTSYASVGLTCGQPYTYYVTAAYQGVESLPSNTAGIMTMPCGDVPTPACSLYLPLLQQ
jgi:hypothetical protein